GAVGALALVAAAAFSRGVRRAGRFSLRWPAALAPLLHVGAYIGWLLARGYRPSFSAMKPGIAFAKDAAPAALFAVACVVLLAFVTRPGRLAPWLLLLTVVAPYAVFAADVGADSMRVAPPVGGVLVLELGPAVVGAGLAAVAMTVVDLVVTARQNAAL